MMSIRVALPLLLFCMLGSNVLSAAANKYDYQLEAVEIAESVYIFEGKTEDFSFQNGGNIVNTAFVVTDEGVVVIDSGSSRRYGEQQRAAISSVTDKPILAVFLTHHHPDHFLGNQAYSDRKIYALPETTQSMKVEGENFRTNMYRLVGDWMRDTRIVLPQESLTFNTKEFGNHTFQFLSVKGHTSSDLVIFEKSSGVLFAGDLVFHNRTPTTPHANIQHWQQSLSEIKQLPFKILVPGHGPISNTTYPVNQTSDYLNWLNTTLRKGASNGFDMNEMMRIKIPERFHTMALLREEFIRSVSHLYPALENEYLKPVNQ